MVRLKDIAEVAGMSITQVSRALNNHNDVSEETRIKINELAKNMGYIKNITAQKLVMQVSNQVVLLIKGFEDVSNIVEYNSIYPILRGINTYMNEVKYELVVYIVQEDIESYINYFQEKGIKNAILFGFDYDDEKLHDLLHTDHYCVCVDIPIEGKNKGCVITNNTLYATQAVEVLLNKGKKNIAMITGGTKAIVSIEREAGYRVALRKQKIRVREEYILNANFNKTEAKYAALQVMSKYPKIDAFFCASDYMALGCMEAIEESGKKIPQDIAIIGFDNIPITKYVKPRLSTVAQDDYQKGYKAAQLMVGMMKGIVKEKTIILNCEVKVREST